MRRLQRLALAAAVSVAITAPGRADEPADRLLTAFRNICLVKPDSIWAIDALAVSQGFVRGFDRSLTVKASPANPGDLYNLILDWRLSEGERKIALSGLVLDNNPLSYELLCQMDADGVLPDDVITALKTTAGLGDLEQQRHENSSRVTLRWKIAADPRQDMLQVDYDPTKGRQRIGLSFEQDIRTSISK
jgi:hypothetical protein